MNCNIDITDIILKTNRLILRPFVETDLEDFYEYASVDGIGQMAGWSPHKSIEESKMILDIFISEKMTFAIEYHNKVIGSIGIKKYNEEQYPEFYDKKCREIGFVLSKEYWGQGIMPEAVKRVIEYLFCEVNLDIIFCGHFLWNNQSKRVQEKCGFKHYANDIYQTSMNTLEENSFNILIKEDWLSFDKQTKTAE